MEDLKNRLILYGKNGWKFPENIDGDSLADEIVEALASTDSALRDGLALSAFDPLVMSGKVSFDKCRHLLKHLLSEKCILNGLGKECDDTVFGRAFYPYAIGTLLVYDEENEYGIFSKEDVKSAYDTCCNVFIKERDLRDFVDIKGWAHATSHMADFLCGYDDRITNRKQRLTILDAIKNKILVNYHYFKTDEGKRLGSTIIGIIGDHDLTEQEFENWVASFFEYDKIGDFAKDDCVLHNRRFFFSQLKYELGDNFKENYPHLLPYIENAFEKANREWIEN